MKAILCKIPAFGLIVTFALAVYALSIDNLQLVSLCLLVFNLCVIVEYITIGDYKNWGMLLFLVTFLVGIGIAINWKMFPSRLFLYLVNIFFIASYIALFFTIIWRLRFKVLWREFKYAFFIVLIVFVVAMYFMTEVLIENKVALEQFMVETLYNIMITLVLCASFMGYLYHDSKKHLLLLIISLCFVFSEMIQLFFISMAKDYAHVLKVVYKLLAFGGFFSCFLYVRMKKNLQ